MTLNVDVTSLVQQKRKSIHIAREDCSVQGGVSQLAFLVEEVCHELHALHVLLQWSCQVVHRYDCVEDILEINLRNK